MIDDLKQFIALVLKFVYSGIIDAALLYCVLVGCDFCFKDFAAGFYFFMILV